MTVKKKQKSTTKSTYRFLYIYKFCHQFFFPPFGSACHFIHRIFFLPPLQSSRYTVNIFCHHDCYLHSTTRSSYIYYAQKKNRCILYVFKKRNRWIKKTALTKKKKTSCRNWCICVNIFFFMFFFLLLLLSYAWLSSIFVVNISCSDNNIRETSGPHLFTMVKTYKIRLCRCVWIIYLSNEDVWIDCIFTCMFNTFIIFHHSVTYKYSLGECH